MFLTKNYMKTEESTKIKRVRVYFKPSPTAYIVEEQLVSKASLFRHSDVIK